MALGKRKKNEILNEDLYRSRLVYNFFSWIDADSDSEDGADSAIKTENAGSSTTKDAVIKKEDAGSSSVNKDDCFRVPVSPAIKMDVE